MRRALAAVGILLAIVLLGLFLPGGAGRKGREEAGAPIPVVAVGSEWYGHLPVWVGIEEGIFRKHGFAVSWRPIGKSMDRLNAISSGDVQFASLGEIAMLSAMAQGNHRFYWVGCQDIAPGFEGLVARPGIRSLADLKGKRIGFPFGSSVEITCRLLLAAGGLDPARDVTLVNLEVGDVPAAFRAGGVDAALIWEPGFSQLRDLEGATVLGLDTDTEIYKRFGTMTGPDVLILSRPWADADPARARRFLGAYFEALDRVKADPDAAAARVVGTYVRQDLALFRKHLAKFVWNDLAAQRRVMSDAALFGQAAFVARIMHRDMGIIPRIPDFRAWVRLDLLPEAGS